MELETVVRYKGAYAHYVIRLERSGIYQAYLKKYEGDAESAPPINVTLARGIRHWVGSSSQNDLMNEIGSEIERCLTHNKDIFPGRISP